MDCGAATLPFMGSMRAAAESSLTPSGNIRNTGLVQYLVKYQIYLFEYLENVLKMFTPAQPSFKIC